MGAGIQAALIAGEDVGAVLVDITPHSLGIRCLDYHARHRFPLPLRPDHSPQHAAAGARAARCFSTVHDNQKEVEIEVYQGENDDVRFNHRIGNFRIAGLANVPAGNQLVVQCDLNLDGMLKVSAKEKATGLSKAGHDRKRPVALRGERDRRGARTARSPVGHIAARGRQKRLRRRQRMTTISMSGRRVQRDARAGPRAARRAARNRAGPRLAGKGGAVARKSRPRRTRSSWNAC